jgi:MEMO1 family protein
MAEALPALRTDLDLMPSPIAGRPGILMRDPYRYSEAVLVVPPLLARCLDCFDGAHTALDLGERLARLTGQLAVSEIAADLARTLSEAGFLQDAAFTALRDGRRSAFRQAETRHAVHAGGGYPDDPVALERTLASWIDGSSNDGDGHGGRGRSPANGGERLLGIAAPHVSPIGGPAAYGAAYGALGRDLASSAGDLTFVILGTSHYGEPHRFGLTRKAFTTPLGRTETDGELLDELERGNGGAEGAFVDEDYCHAVEHSIEFQVLFLQHLLGRSIRILPILCGPFVGGPPGTRRPENDPLVARALERLGELHARHGSRLVWVLGVDLAHVGRRYGDPAPARAGVDGMHVVEARDRARLGRVTAGDAAGFWELLNDGGGDDLKWCGAAPLYTFLRAVPEARGHLLRYDQWNIDDASVVSFAALRFSRA